MQTGILRELRYWTLHIQICLGGSPWDCQGSSQLIQRNSHGPGGHVIVGASGNISIELLYHEIGAITNLLQRLTIAGTLNH